MTQLWQSFVRWGGQWQVRLIFLWRLLCDPERLDALMTAQPVQVPPSTSDMATLLLMDAEEREIHSLVSVRADRRPAAWIRYHGRAPVARYRMKRQDHHYPSRWIYVREEE